MIRLCVFFLFFFFTKFIHSESMDTQGFNIVPKSGVMTSGVNYDRMDDVTNLRNIKQ